MGMKRDLSLGALTVLLGGMTYASYAYDAPVRAEELKCSSITDCGGSQSCGTKGKENACVLTCDDGGSVTCAPKEDGR